MRKEKLKIGKEIIEPAPPIFEMADRLAGEFFSKEAHYVTKPINKVLGTIYLMKFMHAFEAMEDHDSVL